MNPDTDVGKKDIPQHSDSRFTEIDDVSSRTQTKGYTLGVLSPIHRANCCGDKRQEIRKVDELYAAVKRGLAERGKRKKRRREEATSRCGDSGVRT